MDIREKLLDKFSRSRIVFWFDEEGNFKDDIENLNLEDVNICKVENNEFYLKYLIEKEKPSDKFLLYYNCAQPPIEKNWLADILLYSDVFFADHKSLIKDELNVRFAEFDYLYNDYRTFFNNKKRLSKLKSYLSEEPNYKELSLGMIATVINAAKNDLEAVLFKIFENGLDEEDNEALEQLAKYNLDLMLYKIIKEHFKIKSEEITLIKFALLLVCSHILLTAPQLVKQNLFNEYIESFEGKGLQVAGHFVEEWLYNSKHNHLYSEISQSVDNKANLSQKLVNLNLGDLADVYSLENIENIILDKMAKEDIENNIEYYLDTIEKRKQSFWWEIYQNTYLSIEYYLKFEKSLIAMHPDADKIENLLSSYTTRLYSIDINYRKFIYYYKNGNNDLLLDYYKKLENKYYNFINLLNSKWDSLLTYDFINDNSHNQVSFYKKFIEERIEKSERVCVIISDALRYEIGCELVDALSLNANRLKVDLDYLVANIPTITTVGMASLLPHNKIEIKDDGSVLVDDKPATNTKMRNDLLVTFNNNSLAITEEDVNSLTTSQLKDLFKGKNLIFIYQNIIDKIGDDNVSEGNVFNAVEQCLGSLEKIIKKLGSSNITNIIITSDHGFIYIDSKIEEHLKIDFPFDKSKISLNPRYVLGDNIQPIANSHYFEKIDNGEIKRNNILIPKNMLRFKSTNGASKRFLHGGVSLQELILPLIKIRHTKKQSKRSVDFEMISPTKNIITSNNPKFKFLQSEPISKDVLPLKIKVGVYDSNNNLLSSVGLVNFDANSEDINDRTKVLTLKLKPISFDKDKTYRLKFYDEDNEVLIKEYDFKINILISNDFF
jgi:uncharacterized protein (TIGR02687 family)